VTFRGPFRGLLFRCFKSSKPEMTAACGGSDLVDFEEEEE